MTGEACLAPTHLRPSAFICGSKYRTRTNDTQQFVLDNTMIPFLLFAAG